MMPRSRWCSHCTYCEQTINILTDKKREALGLNHHDIEHVFYCHKKKKTIKDQYSKAKQCKDYFDECKKEVQMVKNLQSGDIHYLVK